jgi:hypothetical protein
MEQRHRSPGWVSAFIALLILLVAPAIYVAGYFWAGNYHQNLVKTVVIRSYDFTWEKTVFSPAGKVEQRLTGKEILLTTKRP